MDNSIVPDYFTLSPEGELQIRVQNVREAKLAIKQLKIKKKELALAKKQIVMNQKIIRAEYTEARRRQGPMMRGGKTFGSIIRSVQSAQRYGAKVDLANKLAPLDREKFRIEAIISTLEQGILNIESYIMENIAR